MRRVAIVNFPDWNLESIRTHIFVRHVFSWGAREDSRSLRRGHP
jgi:hypothetical protein